MTHLARVNGVTAVQEAIFANMGRGLLRIAKALRRPATPQIIDSHETKSFIIVRSLPDSNLASNKILVIFLLR